MRRALYMLLIAALVSAGCSAGRPAAAPPSPSTQPAHENADAVPAAGPMPGPQADNTGQSATAPAAMGDASWGALPALKLEAVQWGGYDHPLDVAPDGQHVAYCSAGGIRTSADDGSTWHTVPTGPVATLAAAGDFPVLNMAGPNQAMCSSVLIDASHPNSVYATFNAERKGRGAPPVYEVGYYTDDNGRTWNRAPAPTGTTDGDFGGFRRRSDGIVALFHGPRESDGTSATLTTDGGATWKAATLGCLTDSTCVAFGAPQTERGSCAMHPYEQPLLLSADRGQSWTAVSLPDRVNACNPAQLVATGPGQAMLVRQWSDFPLLRTVDGGKTWAKIALPPVPHTTVGGPLHAGLQMVPDGTLIGRDGETVDGDWLWLKPGAKEWCALPARLLANTAGDVRATGNGIWWVESDSNGAASGVGHVELEKLQCAS